MKTLMLDTNVLIALFRGDQLVADVIAEYDRILVPAVVLGEFKAGVALDARNGVVQSTALEDFLDSPFVDVVSVTKDTADVYARVYKALRERGRPIPQNDLWIAAQSLEVCATLFTRDVHFTQVPLLKCVGND